MWRMSNIEAVLFVVIVALATVIGDAERGGGKFRDVSEFHFDVVNRPTFRPPPS
jgi:hypothetical protein